jgi:Flp pilus assembly pilin Flp
MFVGRCGRIYPFGTDRELGLCMNNNSKTVKSVRGAAMVEYALLLVAILLLAGGAFKILGAKTSSAVSRTYTSL